MAYFNESFQLRCERDFSEKINGSFTFMAQNFKPLMGIVLRMCGPAIVSMLLLGSVFSYNILVIFKNGTGPDEFISSELFVALIYVGLMLGYLVILVLIQATVYGYMFVYVNDRSNTVTFQKVWSYVRKRLLSLYLYKLLLIAACVAGFAIAILPGIYLMIIFSLFSPIFILENKSFKDSVSRCFEIIREKWWSTFGLQMVLGLIISAGSYVVYLPVLVLTMLFSIKFKVEFLWVIIIATGGLMYAAYFMFAITIESISTGLQYFNLVEKQDGTGLREQIEQIGIDAEPESETKGDF